MAAWAHKIVSIQRHKNKLIHRTHKGTINLMAIMAVQKVKMHIPPNALTEYHKKHKKKQLLIII